MPASKEIHYYGSDLSGLASQLTPAQHESLFVGTEQKKRVGETCIWALYSAKAAEEIRDHVPEAQLIIMLREPVEMMYALHSEFVWGGVENVKRFSRAIALEDPRKHGQRLPANGLPAKILFYREVASFAEQVQRYYRVFGPERVHVILFDDFRSDLPGVYRRLLHFLGVDPTFRPEFQVVRRNRRVRSIRLRNMLTSPRPSVQHLARTIIPLPGVRRQLHASLNAWNAYEAPRRPLREQLQRQLRAEMAADVRRLSVLLHRDLSHWSAP